MSYLPEVAWTTLIQDVIMLTPTTYRVTVVPIDSNEPGGVLGDKEIGYYLKDNVGHTYSITALNVDGSWDNIEITDDFNTGYGPQTSEYAYVYKSVGDGEAPYLAPIRHERLDNSALDYSRAIELDVLWKNKAGISVQEFPVDIQRFGFLNQTETTLSFSDTTKIFTLAPVGTSWSYYRSGLKHTITGSKTVDLTTAENPLVNGRTYFIYIDSTTGTLIADVSVWTLRDTKVPVATVLWNNTLTPKYLLAEERHSCLIDRRMHFYEHYTNGAKAITLGALSNYTPNSDVNASKTFSIADSIIADEDILNILSALADPNGTNTDYFVMYRSGSSWVWKASNMPFIYNVGNTNNQIQYDNNGTITDSTGGNGSNTRYLNSYLLMTNFKDAARFIITPGRAQFTTLALAQAENPSTFVWTGFPVQEALIAYQITWSTVTSTSQGKCVLSAIKNISLSAIATIGLGNTIDHETLANLQGGVSGQHNHLSDAELLAVGGIPAKASAAEIVTGTDDEKFATPKGLKDAEFIPIHVGTTPPTDTNILWLDTN